MASRVGWIYVLTNRSMPGIVKIGLTTRDPEARAKEISGATGVPTPFEIAHRRRVKDCFAVEHAIHRQLDRYRVGKNREFFQMSLAEAKRTVDAIAMRYERLDAPLTGGVHWLLRIPLWLLFWWILEPVWLWRQGVLGKVMVGLAVAGLLVALLHEPSQQALMETAAPIATSAAVTLQPLLPIGGPAPAATPTPTPAPTAMVPAETPTPEPTAAPTTATIRPSDTPAAVSSERTPTADRDTDLHAGPGSDFLVTGIVRAGDPLPLVGRTHAGDWYQLADGHWIAADAVVNAPDDLPVVGVRLTPVSGPTLLLTPVSSEER